MAEWTEFEVEANGLRLHVTRTGNVNRTGSGDKPTVVLAHGFCNDGLCWTPLARALEADYDVVMPDARGNGRSDLRPQEFSCLDLADDLAALITALGLEQPIILGHSMGAMTAMLVAARYPALPRAIVLEDPPAWWPPIAEPQMFSTAWNAGTKAWLAELQRQPREQLLASEAARLHQWPVDAAAPWADSKRAFRLSFLDFARPPRLDWLGADWPAGAPAVSCPVLLLTGEPALSAIITEAQAEALTAWLPQLRRIHLAGAGHCLRCDQFEAYLTALRPALAAWSGAG